MAIDQTPHQTTTAEDIFVQLGRHPAAVKKKIASLKRAGKKRLAAELSALLRHHPSRPENKPEPAKFKPCDIGECLSCCCHNGANLGPGEETLIKKAVKDHPEHFAHLPKRFLQNMPEPWGLRTRAARFNFHRKFPFKTRCVFAHPKTHLCTLQTLAAKTGEHKWAYKPEACCLFPAFGHTAKLAPADNAKSPFHRYMERVPCASHHPDGSLPEKAFSEELTYKKQ